MARVLVLGLSPFLITASDSGLIIIMNMLIRHYGSYEMGDVLLTCNTIVQSFYADDHYAAGEELPEARRLFLGV